MHLETIRQLRSYMVSVQIVWRRHMAQITRDLCLFTSIVHCCLLNKRKEVMRSGP